MSNIILKNALNQQTTNYNNLLMMSIISKKNKIWFKIFNQIKTIQHLNPKKQKRWKNSLKSLKTKSYHKNHNL